MPLTSLKKLITKAMIVLTMISLGACAKPIPDACAWLKPISPDPGFEMRWTRAEKAQVDAIDLQIDANCR